MGTANESMSDNVHEALQDVQARLEAIEAKLLISPPKPQLTNVKPEGWTKPAGMPGP